MAEKQPKVDEKMIITVGIHWGMNSKSESDTINFEEDYDVLLDDAKKAILRWRVSDMAASVYDGIRAKMESRLNGPEKKT
jgi:hypothetical protein